VAGAKAAARSEPAAFTRAGILPGLAIVLEQARELTSRPWQPANEIAGQVLYYGGQEYAWL